MEYTTRAGDRPSEAHVNYQCPCGCVAGLMFEREQGAQHLGQCCCGRMLWVGTDSEGVVRENYKEGLDYELDHGRALMPWGEELEATLAIPLQALAKEQAKREAGLTPSKVTDPVCRMMIDPLEAAGTSEFRGSTYHFCASACKTKFDAEPGAFVRSRGLLDRHLGRA